MTFLSLSLVVIIGGAGLRCENVPRSRVVAARSALCLVRTMLSGESDPTH